MKVQDMITLGRLPELGCLILYSRYTKLVSIKNIGGDCYFQKLRFFTMGSSSILFDLRCDHTIMPSLESLAFGVHVQFLKDADLLGFDKLGSVTLPSSLQEFKVLPLKSTLGMHMLRRWQKQRPCWHMQPCPIFQTTRPFGKYTTLLPDQEPSSTKPKVYNCAVNLQKKDEDRYIDFRWLLMNPRVEKFSVSINCENARLGEIEEAEVAARYAVDVHPNRPTLQLVRYGEDKMALSDQQQQGGSLA